MNAKLTRRRHGDIETSLLGFGLMRLPLGADGKIDRPLARTMVRDALDAGVTYFDTAWMYLGGESECFVGDVFSGVPRDSYTLTSKMPMGALASAGEMEGIFAEQLRRTGAGRFDFYLLHALSRDNWDKAKRFKTLDFVRRKRDEGLIGRIGFSFHDTPETLREIADAFEWDIAQIQLNFVDWESYRSREQYEILSERNIPVSIMEPLRGGSLVNLNAEARGIFKEADSDAPLSSWGLRFAASLPGVQVVLSGMSTPEQVRENVSVFSPFRPLSDDERGVIARAVEAYGKSGVVPCTGCKYCQPCPFGVNIPANIALFNEVKRGGRDCAGAKAEYSAMPDSEKGANCRLCRACLAKCPQKLQIPVLMKQIAGEFHE